MSKVLRTVEEIRKRLFFRMDADGEGDDQNNKNNKKGKPKAKHSALSTRLPYALCKEAGIDTTGMTPREAWDAYAGKTGESPKEIRAEKMGTEPPSGGSSGKSGGASGGTSGGSQPKKESGTLARIKQMSGGLEPDEITGKLKSGSTIESIISGSGNVEDVADACEKYYKEKGKDSEAYRFGVIKSRAKDTRETKRVQDEINGLDVHSGDVHEKTKKVLDDAPAHTVISFGSGIAYTKQEDGTWLASTYGISGRSIDTDGVASGVEKGLATPISYYKPRISVKTPIPFSKERVKDWYDTLENDKIRDDRGVEKALDSLPDGSAIWVPGYRDGAIAGLSYKKDGEWRNIGFGGYGTRGAISALEYAKKRGGDSSFISLPTDDREKIEPETDLDKKLTGKLSGDKAETEKALRAMKPGDKITLGYGDKKIEFERVKGGFKKLGSYGTTGIGEAADAISGVHGLPGMSVTVKGVPRPSSVPKTPEEKEAAKKARAEKAKRKEEMRKPYVPSGEKYESPSSLKDFDGYVAKREDYLKSENHVNDDDIAVMREGFKKMFDTHEYGMRVDSKILDKILDTHFMNQQESGRSHGWHSEFGRSKASRELFGHNVELDKVGIDGNGDFFEKYGYMPDDPIKDIEGGSSAHWYGDALVTFKKDRVASRTTFTCADSLGGADNPRKCPGRAGSEPGWEGATHGRAQKIADTFRKAAKEGRNVEPREVAQSYLELQYHGRLTVDDVDALYIRPEYADRYLTEKVKGQLKEKGVRIYIVGRGWTE